MVARGAVPDEVFAAIVEEVARLLAVEFAQMGRYEPDGTLTVLAAWGRAADSFPVGSRWLLEGKNLATTVFETCRPARAESMADASGPVGITARDRGFRSAVATPILLEGRLWGVVIAGSSRTPPLPANADERLASFTELLATAVANAESRADLTRLGEEQAGLRRVATLVARGMEPEDVFTAAVEEVGQLLPVEYAHMARYDPDGSVAFIAAWGRGGPVFPVGTRFQLGGKNVATIVFETGGPARIDNWADGSGPLAVAVRERGVRWSVGTPIMVDGRLWGLMAAGALVEQPLLPDTEARLARFTELLAAAVANAESRAGLALLAEQQAGLRRVATLVARGIGPAEVFTAIVEEVGQLLTVEYAHMGRYEPDGSITFIAAWGREGLVFPPGTRFRLGGRNISTVVFETGRPARIDSYANASGPVAVALRERGVRWSVGTPIMVDGRLWGLIAAGALVEQRRLPDTEARLAQFTELLATAISNAESRAALAASRARIVAAADETRRRIERDLHDGAQQRLVSLGLELRAAQATVPPQAAELERELSRIAEGLASVFQELREISQGVHPAILSTGGLEPALKALARRSAVPVELDLRVEQRLPEHVEVAIYYVISEALTNAAKHAQATHVQLELQAGDAAVQLTIHDDGIGGADPTRGSGLVGLGDRVEAIGGTLRVISPPASGTTLQIEIPLEAVGPPDRAP